MDLRWAYAAALSMGVLALPGIALTQNAVFRCQLTESVEIADRSGLSKRENVRNFEEIYAFSPSSFKIYDVKLARWSPNYCLPDSPDNEEKTRCEFGNAELLSTWLQYSSELVGPLIGRRAKISFNEKYVYQVLLQNQGVATIRFERIKRTSNVTYFTVDANGRIDFMKDYNRPNENWAGYNMKVTGRGSCRMVQ